MNNPKIQQITVRAMNYLAAAVLVLVPFHALITVRLGSWLGQYTLIRIWEEAVLVLLLAGAMYLVMAEKMLRRILLRSRLMWIIGAFLLMQLVWGIAAYRLGGVSAKALGYGWIVDSRFLVFFAAVWVLGSKSGYLLRHWQRLVFWPAAIVIIFGLVEYFLLPYDFMRHLGYSAATIYPYETINHNIHYIRAMSTLRGANPLGAYLVVVLSLLGAVLPRKRTYWHMALLAGGVLLLVLSFSRSAWIGLFLSLLTLAFCGVRSRRIRYGVAGGVLAAVLVLGTAALLLRHNLAVQNALLHTQEHSAVQSSSNGGHRTAIKQSMHDLAHAPLGRGPGTAGPASVYNIGHQPRIAESFWVQISQEIGWLGLALFVAIILIVGRQLWLGRSDTLALGLLAALVGVSFINLLSHAWADETLAYLFWGLTGLSLATNRTDLFVGKSRRKG